ncbi:N-terminal C2 domain-containing protein [Rhodotorula paludigena]|uniref:N-terminal C2 domain-containing protein n=1 Tax=Rhodotorula paludigena TaxID=86838 RepID=UPI00317B88B8
MGFADSLGFGKTATFQATVTVHELLQVPLLNAKFRVKWKFKGATHSHSSASTDDSARNAAAGFGFLHPRTALSSSTNTTASDRRSGGPGASTSRSRSTSPLGVYSSEDNDDARSPSTRSPPRSPEPRARSATQGTASGLSFTSPFSGNAETLYASPPTRSSGAGAYYDSGHNTSPDGPEPSASGPRRRGAGDLTSSLGASGPTAIAHRPEPKGSTVFLPLRNHTATFNREVTCPVQIPLKHVTGTSKYQLQPSPVRLAVKQEVLLEDGKREEERLGEVILDLSQFASHGYRNGVVEETRPRRYLLQGCKSNAVLRVSVKMEWIEGEKSFVAPPLRSGQLPTGSSAAKGLVSTGNTPTNRSSASLVPKSASGSSNGRSKSSTSLSMQRVDSVSSRASSSSPAWSRSSHNGAETPSNGAPKKKGWHPPAGAFSSNPAPTLLSGAIGHSSGGADRSAADVIEAIFNRPPTRKPSWVGLSAAASAHSRSRTPTLDPSSANGKRGKKGSSSSTGSASGGEERLGEPFELRTAGGARSKFSCAAGKAWSIRSKHATRDKDPQPLPRGGLDEPPQLSAARYARLEAPAEAARKHKLRLRTRDVTHTGMAAGEPKSKSYPPQPDLHVQPPTPQPPFERTLSQPSPARPAHPPPPPPAPSCRPPSVASTATSGSTKPLSVRWTDHATGARSSSRSSSPPPAFAGGSSSTTPTPPSSLPSPVATEWRALRPAKSAESLGGKRPASSLSFNSVVTPPSPPPDLPRGAGAARGGSEARRDEAPTPQGTRRGKAAEGPGAKAPGGVEWGKSWS